MKRHAPQVREYMTHLPVEAERCESAEQAMALMQQHDVHHLPVMSGSHLKAIVSLHELLQARAELGDRFSATPLEQISTSHALTVSPVDPIDEVARKMLQRGADAAAVVDSGFVVGVFTTTDAMRFICDFFGQPKTT
jgi:acetoin utilization protein AcuB